MTARFNLISTALLLLLVLAGCKIEGTVTHQDQGVDGVEVSLEGPVSQTAQTNGSGAYSFRFLKKGEYTVTPSKTGYEFSPQSRKVILESHGAEKKADFEVTATHAPQISISADPRTIDPGGEATLSWSCQYVETVRIDQGIGEVDPSGSKTVSPEEDTTYTLTAESPLGSTESSAKVTVGAPKPEALNVSDRRIQHGESVTLNWDVRPADTAYFDQDIGEVAPRGNMTRTPDYTTTYHLTAVKNGNTRQYVTSVKVLGNPPEPQPEGSFGEQYQDKVPDDASLKSYDPERYILLTGLVRDGSGDPLSGVKVEVIDHPEYGSTQTDAEGRFSLPAEGGGLIKLAYSKPDYLTAHRKTDAPVRDVVTMDPVTLIQRDSASTKVEFNGDPDSVTTHQSTQVSDEFGSRSASMVFTGDNTAYALDKYGNRTRELDSITTRATEYTTRDSMPARLPPNSAYTYCAELAADEARRVEFEDPVTTYVDNFLGFEVGEAVPVGYYDRDRAEWIPAENGVVVQLLDTSGDGNVDALDADGDGQADDLNDNGSTGDEVTGLSGSSYQPGDTYWRFRVKHLTPWDCNWPWGPPIDAISPNPEGEPTNKDKKEEGEDCNTSTGSHVQDRSRVLHEDIPIPGTEMSLHYASDRVKAYKTGIYVPVSGNSVPSSLNKIIVQCQIAGQTMRKTLAPQPNQKAEFLWDGRDYEGDKVSTPVHAHVRIGFVYEQVYYSSSDEFRRAWAQPGDSPTDIWGRFTVTYWQNNRIQVSPPQAKTSGSLASGWTLTKHHQLSRNNYETLHKGNGGKVKNTIDTSTTTGMILPTVAGTGNWGYSGDGGPATKAQLHDPTGVTLNQQGSLYIADRDNHCIRKVSSNGTIITVAGTGNKGYSGDGGPAAQAQLSNPSGLALDDKNNLYIADTGNHCIRKVDPRGIITTIAGSGTKGYSGKGGPAKEAQLASPKGLTVDKHGNIYIVERDSNCVSKVNTNKNIINICGQCNKPMPRLAKDNVSSVSNNKKENKLEHFSSSPSSDPNIKINLYGPNDIIRDEFGNIYISDTWNNRILQIDTSGNINTVAGTGSAGYSGDHGPATQAKLYYPKGIHIDGQGNLYIADSQNHCIRKVDSSGTITTVVGTSKLGYNKNTVPATQARLDEPKSVFVDENGDMYIADSDNARICMGDPTPISHKWEVDQGSLLFTDSGGSGYVMGKYSGRHKETIDLATDNTIYNFHYNQNDKLTSISDRFGNTVNIQRQGDSPPDAIVSPEGQRTTLRIDASNHLTGITLPDGSSYSFQYTQGGLLTQKIDPALHQYDYAYNNYGRLTDTYDEHGGHWRFRMSSTANGQKTYKMITGENNEREYIDRTYSTGKYSSDITGFAGGVTQYTRSADGFSAHKSTSCGMDLDFKYGINPRYQHYLLEKSIQKTPSGLTKSTSLEKGYQDTTGSDAYDLIVTNATVNGRTTTTVQNILDSQKTISSPEGRTTTIDYDFETLLPKKIQIPELHTVTFSYNNQGDLTQTKRNARETSYTYNQNGYLKTLTDPQGRTTTFTRDAMGRVTQLERPNGSKVEFSYDDNGNMLMLTNPENVDHEFDYNQVDKRSTYYTPLSGSYSYEYDTERKLTRINFPSGKQITNVYDKGRLSRIETPESTIDYTYAPCGSKVASVSRGANSISYTYDGKLVTSKELQGVVNSELSFTYNNDFRVTEMSYAGATESYAYDSDGLLTSAGDFSVSRNSQNGLPESVSDGSYSQSRSFNGYGEISHRETAVAGYGLYTSDITRNDNGKITEKTVTLDGETHTYTYDYDDLGRLTEVSRDGSVVEQYEYDPDNTRVSQQNTLRGIDRSLSYDEEDRLLTAGETQHQYSADGFLTEKTRGSNSTQYEYSSRGELLYVDLPDGTSIDYTYGPKGRRMSKSVNGTVTRKYLWQGLTRLLAVYDGSDNLLMRFEYADGRTPVAMTKNGQKYYLISNQVGSLRAVADSSGNLVKRIDYDSFGNVIRDTNPSFQIPFRFAGGLYDKHTGLIRFGHRDYDPQTGRWTAKDPILFAGGNINLYGYCLNDPVNLEDPEGLWIPQAIGAAVSLGLEGYRQYRSGDLDVGRLAMAAATGALPGFGNTLGKAIFMGATASMANNAYQQFEDPCNTIDTGEVVKSGLYGSIGGLTGYGGGQIGKMLHKPISPIGKTIGNMPATHYGATGTAVGSALGGYIANQ